VLIRAVVLTFGARLLSALLSFAVFSQVASSLEPTAAAQVLFFSFVFGFSLATLRTFHLVAAAVDGSESRAYKLRRLRQAAATLRRVMLLAVPAALGLLVAQGVGWPAALVGAVLVGLCGQDLDLVRSVVGRPPVLPLLTMVGGLLGIGLLVVHPSPSMGWCAAAFLVQWLPAAVLQVVCGRRWLAPPSAHERPTANLSSRVGRTTGLFLTAVFDGAVLNGPFLIVVPLAASAAVDLALGNRLFVASLALFSLVASWVISGDMQRIASRHARRPGTMFVVLQSVLCLAIGSAYALVYHLITDKPVGPNALLVFLLLTLAYVIHSAGLRFLLPKLPMRAGVVTYAAALACFYAVLLWQDHSMVPSFSIVTGAVVCALCAPSLMLWALLSSRR
jgi:hypothetical protein